MIAVAVMAAFVLLGSAKVRGAVARKAGKSAQKNRKGLLLLALVVIVLAIGSAHGGHHG